MVVRTLVPEITTRKDGAVDIYGRIEVSKIPWRNSGTKSPAGLEAQDTSWLYLCVRFPVFCGFLKLSCVILNSQGSLVRKMYPGFSLKPLVNCRSLGHMSVEKTGHPGSEALITTHPPTHNHPPYLSYSYFFYFFINLRLRPLPQLIFRWRY